MGDRTDTITTTRHATSQGGFSLVEVLVALTVLSIAAGGLIGVGEAHVQRVDRLETRTIAQWIAQNELARLRMNTPSLASDREVTMLDREWTVETRQTETDDPDLMRFDVFVTEAGQTSPAANLTGFIDMGATAP